MDSFLRVLLPFFGPKDYSEMLWKIALSDFWLTLACTFVARTIPSVDAFFSTAESWPPFHALMSIFPVHQANLAGVFLAFIVLVFSRSTRFHDRVSDLFGIST
jgi:hypothetical protein